MEAQDTKDHNTQLHRYISRHRSGRVLGGSIIVLVGILLLARELGVVIPEWIFSWPMILIALGLIIGAKNSFRGTGWVILLGIGTIFLLNELSIELPLRQLLWPILIICIGLAMIVRPKRHKWHHYDRWERWIDWEKIYTHGPQQSSDNFLDTTTVFGGTKKNIITKDFKGGDLTTLFGGTELNFMQADITGTVVIDITQIFGGTKLVIPPHWTVKSEDLVTVFGSIEDKRPIRAEGIQDSSKVLVLRGTCVFGGIDIKSY